VTVVAELVQDVLVDGGFDTTEARVLRWLNVRHRQMVARAKCFRRTLELGPTVENQRDYAVPPEVVELTELVVAGNVYGEGRHADLALGAAGRLWISGNGGISTREDDASGSPKIALYPTPTASGEPITAQAVCLPPDLSVTDDTTLKVPANFQDSLVEGAIATGLARLENQPALAQPRLDAFEAACRELEQETAVRLRGTAAPVQIRIAGYNA
jgi:8-oxo-dGTP pyrophosphatase MutT (NUDIX family)